MLLAWSPAGRKEKGDSEERRGPLTATTALWGHSEPLCSPGQAVANTLLLAGSWRTKPCGDTLSAGRVATGAP